MPILIKDVIGEIYDEMIGEVIYLKSVIGDIQDEDYINLPAFKAYLQNLTRAETVEKLKKPINFGLVNKYKVPMVTLQINY